MHHGDSMVKSLLKMVMNYECYHLLKRKPLLYYTGTL